MKIICCIESLGSGGAERQLVGLACSLNEFHDVSVYTYDKKNFYLYMLKEKGVHNHQALDSNIFKRICSLLKYLKYENPDVVISFSRFSSIIACIGVLAGLRYKLIVSERNTTQHIDFAERVKFFLYRFADTIVPNSYSQQDFIINNFEKLSSKTFVITNFVDTIKFCPSKKFSTEDNLLNVLVVARVMEQKNTFGLIKSLKAIVDKCPKIRVKWYGDLSHTEYYDKCVELRDTLGLSSYIEFFPPSPNIVEQYNSADVFCLPSFYEGYPNVVCEAMSCGLPILCSNVCDNSKIVKDSENGYLFDPIDTLSIVRAFNKMYALTKEDRHNMSAVNRQKMLDNNSIVEFVNKYKRLIQND